MHTRIISIVILLIISSLIIISCGKTDEDKEREDLIIGTWYTTEIEYDLAVDTVFFVFDSGNDGKTIVGTKEDNFSWEIVRGTLKTYYKKAPDYMIGYDKYNSKGVYAIKKFENDVIKLEQHFYNGVYTTFSIYRY